MEGGKEKWRTRGSKVYIGMEGGRTEGTDKAREGGCGRVQKKRGMLRREGERTE